MAPSPVGLMDWQTLGPQRLPLPRRIGSARVAQEEGRRRLIAARRIEGTSLSQMREATN